MKRVCLRCHQVLETWEYGGSSPWEHDSCPYEACDDYTCRVFKEPKTPEEYRTAYEHWKNHQLYHGCSHGC